MTQKNDAFGNPLDVLVSWIWSFGRTPSWMQPGKLCAWTVFIAGITQKLRFLLWPQGLSPPSGGWLNFQFTRNGSGSQHDRHQARDVFKLHRISAWRAFRHSKSNYFGTTKNMIPWSYLWFTTNVLLSGRRKWWLFVPKWSVAEWHKWTPLLTVRWSYLLCIYIALICFCNEDENSLISSIAW